MMNDGLDEYYRNQETKLQLKIAQLKAHKMQVSMALDYLISMYSDEVGEQLQEDFAKFLEEE